MEEEETETLETQEKTNEKESQINCQSPETLVDLYCRANKHLLLFKNLANYFCVLHSCSVIENDATLLSGNGIHSIT